MRNETRRNSLAVVGGSVLALLVGVLPAVAFGSPPLSPPWSPPVSPPTAANDAFANATEMAVLPFSDAVDTTETTVEANEPLNHCGMRDNTVWYRFTPSRDLTLSIDTLASSYVPALAVYSGTSLTGLRYIACDGQGPWEFALDSGGTYYVQIGAGQSAPGFGSLALRVEEVVVPSNDAFAGATPIDTLPFSEGVRTTFATLEAGEPGDACGITSATVWFSFTAEAATELRFEVPQRDFAPSLAVYSGNTLGDLALLGCGYPFDSMYPPLIVPVEAGVTNYVQLGGGASSLVSGYAQLTVRETVPPPNDDFINAKAVAAVPYIDTIDTTDATNEPSEPATCAGSSMGTAWYVIPASTTSQTLRTWADSGFWAGVGVYTGSALNDLVQVACGYSWAPAQFTAQAGTDYYVQVGGSMGYNRGPVTLNVQPVIVPVNDDFAAAKAVATATYSDTVDAQNATTEPPNEPLVNCGISTRTVWYRIEPSTSSRFRIDTNGSNYPAGVAVYSGTSIASLDLVGCYSSNTWWQSSVEFTASAGTVYYVQVGQLWPSSPAGLTVNITELVPPENDAFADATPITSFPFSGESVDTTNATREPDEPGSCWSSANGGTVWYEISPSDKSRLLRVNTDGSSYAAGVGVFSGTSLGDLQDVACGVPAWYGAVTFTANADTTYYIQVGNYSGSGTLVLNVEELVAPANDAFADAIAIPSFPYTSESVDTANATLEPGEPAYCDYSSQGGTVWYRIPSSPQPRVLEIDTNGTAFPAGIGVFAGSSLDGLSLVNCGFPMYYGGGPVRFIANANTTYYIQVGNYGGAGSLTVNVQELPRPANDSIEQAQVVESLPTFITQATGTATLDPGEMEECGDISSSVWFAYTPAADGTLLASTRTSSYFAPLAVYSGSPGNLALVSCDALVPVSQGVTYYLQAAGAGPGDGELQLRLEDYVAPMVSVTVSGSATLGRDGTLTVTGTLRCEGTDLTHYWLDLSVTQRAPKRQAAQGSAYAEDWAPFSTVTCDGSSRAWSLSMRNSSPAAFWPGSASVQAHIVLESGWDPGVEATAAATVSIKRVK